MKLRPSLDILMLILMTECIIRVAAQPGKVASNGIFNVTIEDPRTRRGSSHIR